MKEALNVLENLPLRLKLLRETNNLTVEEVSELLQITERNYRKYEQGTQVPKLASLIVLSKAFQCTLDQLIGLPTFDDVNDDFYAIFRLIQRYQPDELKSLIQFLEVSQNLQARSEIIDRFKDVLLVSLNEKRSRDLDV